MGFNLHGIGSLIERIPVVGKEANKIINAVGNPIQQIVSVPINLATSMATNMMNMQKTLMTAGAKAAEGLAGFVSSPMFTYLVVGGLAIGGIMVIQNGGKAPLPPQMARMLGK